MKRKNAGFSLIELVIGAALLALLTGVVYTLMNGASSAYVRDSAKQTLQDNTRRVLDDITAELRDASAGTLIISSSPTTITFEKVIGFDKVASKSIGSAPVSFFWEASPVTANEGRIYRSGPTHKDKDGNWVSQKSLICDFVPTNGFTATKPATNRVDLSITNFTMAEGRRKVEVTLTTSVAVRN